MHISAVIVVNPVCAVKKCKLMFIKVKNKEVRIGEKLKIHYCIN